MCPSTRTLTLTPGGATSNFKPAFEVLDADRDGKISYDDLSTFCSGFLSSPADADQDIVGMMISVADLDRDGFVEYDEFEHVLEAAQRGAKSSGRVGGGVMEEVFRMMDKDGDGRLSHGDLRSYMEWAGLEASDEDIKAMIRLGDGDEKNGVSFDGLLKILAVDNILL
ncbi:calcium-binding protein CP1-like [Punica granatum]|uniref:EF-hand domain-containing protein n=2 Tax=Punica granatum TaxID=22663 RepID=A0A218WE02_PUNGR|nr:calcium-binding protein CP1-like [Punica granatum]OWM71094.1 hypothetical protein CDL15_Pgr011221 [Punica granatum]PKI78251.1 hypothetical protein CRG98_001309 [Punica granatum]